MFPRRKTKPLKLGGLLIGGGAPVVVQSMTKTDTRDVKKTVAQIKRLDKAGCEIVRLAVPDRESALALKEVKSRTKLPLIADIHFDHRLALISLESGVDGLRINPGNIGSPEKVGELAKEAHARNVPIRIGINSGSIEREILARFGGASAEAMVASALKHVRMLEDFGFDLIKISLKASDIPRTVEAYRLLADKVDYPFHAGITEAGRLFAGSIKSTAGLAVLLAEGLADTIRVSLTAPPEHEVYVAWKILQDMGLREKGLNFISCPSCGRAQVNIIKIAREVESRIRHIDVPLNVAVMGCSVNGPGEAREADVGLACDRGGGVIFRHGRSLRRVREKSMIEEFAEEVIEISEEIKKTKKANSRSCLIG